MNNIYDDEEPPREEGFPVTETEVTEIPAGEGEEEDVKRLLTRLPDLYLLPDKKREDIIQLALDCQFSSLPHWEELNHFWSDPGEVNTKQQFHKNEGRLMIHKKHREYGFLLYHRNLLNEKDIDCWKKFLRECDKKGVSVETYQDTDKNIEGYFFYRKSWLKEIVMFIEERPTTIAVVFMGVINVLVLIFKQ